VISSAAVHTVLKVGTVCNHLLSFIAPVGLAALIGVAGVWAMEGAPSQTFINTSVINVQSGGNVAINIPVIVKTDARRALYRTWLSDASGVVYEFPDQEVKNPRLLDLTHQDIQIPPSIAPGTYVLNVQVIYPFNPFKNGNIFMTVATLNVDR
jgi:hypothetical protein